MRSTDEQLRLIRGRARRLRERRRSLARFGAGAACCLALILLLSVMLPGVSGNAAPSGEVPFGSLILISPLLSYIVIAILAFVLGACVTLLCIFHRPRPGRSEEEET